MERVTKITAHRGYRKGFRENTLKAFERAIQLGADRIEFDLHFSRNYELIVHHDYYVKTIDGKSELISGTTRSQLQPDVPSLREVLELVGKAAELEIELKSVSTLFVETALESVLQSSAISQIEFTSPHPFVLSKLRSLSSNAKLGMFVQRFPDWMMPELGHQLIENTLEIGGIDVAHCPFSILSTDLVRRLHRENKKVHAADCNTDEELRTAFELGVDQLSTDELDLAKEIRKKIHGV